MLQQESTYFYLYLDTDYWLRVVQSLGNQSLNMTASNFNIFNDLEFEKIVQELDTPDVEGWEFFTESHGVKIYRLYNEVMIYLCYVHVNMMVVHVFSW